MRRALVTERQRGAHLLYEVALVAGVHCRVQAEVRDLRVPVTRIPCETRSTAVMCGLQCIQHGLHPLKIQLPATFGRDLPHDSKVLGGRQVQAAVLY